MLNCSIVILNCFQGDHFKSKYKLKNTCFKNDCSAKHHVTLHEYFPSHQRDRSKKRRKEDPKQNSKIKREEDKSQSYTGMTKEP